MVKDGLTRRTALTGALACAAAPALGREEAAVVNGVALVTPEVVRPDPLTGMLTVRFAFPERPPRRLLAQAKAPRTSAEIRLRRLTLRGEAAGLHGVLYDNRDRGHSYMRVGRWPALSVIRYAESYQAASLDYGLNDRFAFDAVTIGNSSTAVRAGHLWRSLPRLALTRRDGAPALLRHYAANRIYVFPEDRDHDPAHGDMLPANTPYYLLSQGSSGSDRAVLDAVAVTLAALPPSTRTFLAERGLIAPVAQMLMRRARAPDDDAYLTGAAHPTAFEGGDFDHDALIGLAQALTPERAPALVDLAMAAEGVDGPPADPFGDLAAERLLDSPAAIARVALGPGMRRRYVLRATVRDPNNRPARLIWRVLRGVGVTVTPLQQDGGAVAVEAPWQEPAPAPGAPDILSSRIDVGVFADNGAGAGPPSFFSLWHPRDSARVLDAQGRLSAIDYWPEPARGAFDPVLSPWRLWRDDYRYAPDGALLGWTRTRTDGKTRDYCRLGRRVLTRDAQGRPLTTRAVEYLLSEKPRRKGRRVVLERDGAQAFRYTYAGPDDLMGAAAPAADAAEPGPDR